MSEYLELLQWLLYNSLIPLMPIPLVWLGAWLIRVDRDLLSITVKQIDDNDLNKGHRLAWTSIFAAISTTILVASSRKILGLL